MKLSDVGKAGSNSSSVRLSKKLRTHSPENVCVGASPTCDPFIPCLSALGFPATHFLHSTPCIHSPRLGFLGTSLPGSLSHTHQNSCLQWQLLCLLPELAGLPPAKHNEARPGRARLQAQVGPSGTGSGLQTKEAAQS